MDVYFTEEQRNRAHFRLSARSHLDIITHSVMEKKKVFQTVRELNLPFIAHLTLLVAALETRLKEDFRDA